MDDINSEHLPGHDQFQGPTNATMAPGVEMGEPQTLAQAQHDLQTSQLKYENGFEV